MTENSTVFIVDDDPGALESLRWLIEQADLRVKAFRSARAFLDSYRPGETGCLVLDVRMPEMDGLALQQTLRERKIRLPIIFITAYGDVQTCAAAFRGGAIDFLEKPVSDEVLLKRIESLIAQDADRRRGGGGGLFRRPHKHAHADRNGRAIRFDPREEHQGHCSGEKGVRADHLAASGAYLSQDRRGNPSRVGSHRNSVADSTHAARAARRSLRFANSRMRLQGVTCIMRSGTTQGLAWPATSCSLIRKSSLARNQAFIGHGPTTVFPILWYTTEPPLSTAC